MDREFLSTMIGGLWIDVAVLRQMVNEKDAQIRELQKKLADLNEPGDPGASTID